MQIAFATQLRGALLGASLCVVSPNSPHAPTRYIPHHHHHDSTPNVKTESMNPGGSIKVSLRFLARHAEARHSSTHPPNQLSNQPSTSPVNPTTSRQFISRTASLWAALNGPRLTAI